ETPSIKKAKAEGQPKGKAKTKAKSQIGGAKTVQPAVAKLPAKGCTKAKPPIVLEKVTVYTCPNSHNWRVKPHGERKDKAFSWKCGTQEAWQSLREHVLSFGN
ncbi:unnamed protein product, partial [Symbiodinium pilosum]